MGTEKRVVIHEEYCFDEDAGIAEAIEEMQDLSTDALRLWIIQELATTDSVCWWLVDIGVKILKEKMEEKKVLGGEE